MMAAPLFFLAKRFIAGKTIASALHAVRTLEAEGLLATLDFLGEDVEKPEDAKNMHQTYLHLLDEIRRAGLRTNVSLKLSALGLACDEALCVSHLRSIAEHAARNADPFVRIDMEGSAFTQKTLDVFERVYAEHPNVGPVIQAYLERSPGDIERLITQ
jgi:proline dehydrogenase